MLGVARHFPHEASKSHSIRSRISLRCALVVTADSCCLFTARVTGILWRDWQHQRRERSLVQFVAPGFLHRLARCGFHSCVDVFSFRVVAACLSCSDSRLFGHRDSASSPRGGHRALSCHASLASGYIQCYRLGCSLHVVLCSTSLCQDPQRLTRRCREPGHGLCCYLFRCNKYVASASSASALPLKIFSALKALFVSFFAMLRDFSKPTIEG